MTTTQARRDNAPAQRFTEEQIAHADSCFIEAFSEAGLVSETGELVCPKCGTHGRKKVQIKTSTKTGKPYWTCHKCPDTWGSSAIKLLIELDGRDVPEGKKFRDAVATLLKISGPEGDAKTLKRRPSVEVIAAFSAVVDVEVYDAIRESGSVKAAQDYWAAWHIDADVVAQAGSTLLEDAPRVAQALTDRFGLDRLEAAGVVTHDKKGNPLFLFNPDYPVIEVHEAPSGHVVAMQFRPSAERRAKVQAHKAWKQKWSGHVDSDGNAIEASEAWRRAYEKDQSVGPKVSYVTPFLSFKGATPDHLVGCGLKRLVEIPKQSTVYVVEGFKDYLAARTLGVEAYAIPGTGVMPPPRAMDVLKLHDVVVLLDGDEAGAKGREALLEHLVNYGVPARAGDPLREGMDVADILVERHAHDNCDCTTCAQWRATNPWDPATCSCRTCRHRRSGN